MKIILITFITGVLGVTTAFSQQFVVKTNLLPIAWGPIPFTGEYRLVGEAVTGAKQSGQLALSYLGPSGLINLSSVEDTAGNKVGIVISGYRIQGTYKFYLTKDDAPKGFYVGPHISYARAKLYEKGNPDNYIKADFFNLVGMMGYQAISSGGFAFDLFTGVGYKNNSYSVSGSLNSEKFETKNNTKLYFGFNMGIAF